MKRMKKDYVARYQHTGGPEGEWCLIEAKNDIDAKKKAAVLFRAMRNGEIQIALHNSQYVLASKRDGQRWQDWN